MIVGEGYVKSMGTSQRIYMTRLIIMRKVKKAIQSPVALFDYFACDKGKEVTKKNFNIVCKYVT